MKRISEALAFQTVLAPQSVAASTDKTTAMWTCPGWRRLYSWCPPPPWARGRG